MPFHYRARIKKFPPEFLNLQREFLSIEPSMITQGMGSKGAWQNITVCENSARNISFLNQMRETIMA
jgi:hypothetical protein